VTDVHTLVRFEAAKYALTQARSIDEVKDVRDKAEALRLYMRQAGESLEMQNDVAEIKLRAERRCGEMLQDMEKHPAGRPPENRSYDVTDSLPPTLAELGVSRNQSSRWQTIADMPEERFEEHIARTKARNDELTTAGILRVAKDLAREELKQDIIAKGRQEPERALSYQVIHGDMADVLADMEPGSVDVIVTDPPYPREYLPLYEDLARGGVHVLKPGGSMLVMVGQSYLPEILALMTPHIRYQWMVAYLTPGGQSAQLWQRKVNTFWKPVLWFVNGDYDGAWVGDVARSAVNDNDKRYHGWGQSESGMADLLERFTRPGDVVLDPFCGAGTTGVAAVAMGRTFIGIDTEESAVSTSRARLAEVA
jgi:site-specific DNA-methyltransferase (adenine-specific)